MAYTIPYTDEANKGTITIEDNTINQETSLKIPGRNTTAYGSAIAENFLHMLENFASSTTPSNPLEGQLWYDSTPGIEQLKVFDGTNWLPSGGLKKAQTAPEASQSLLGDLWVDTDNQQLYLFSGSGWVLIGPEFSEGLITGITPDIITGTDDLDYSVLLLQVSAQVLGVFATASFTPKVKIPGFTVIQPGFNLSTNDITGAGVAKYYGTAEKAEALIVSGNIISAANFLRGDVISTTSFPINVRNNAGVNYGINAEFNIGVSGSSGIIQHNVAGSSIDVKVKNDGLLKTVMRIDSDLKIGINNIAPETELDVTGAILASNYIKSSSTEDSTSLNNGAIRTAGGAAISKNAIVGGNLNVFGSTTITNVEPDQSNFRNLGTTTKKFANVYSTTFIGNLTGNVSGTVSGRAGSADKLTSPSTMRITGDVTADDVLFDGQVGGSIKIFNTTLSNQIISAKPNILVSQPDDEFLMNRTSGNTGIKKISRQNLLAAVPVNPIGIIVPYAGIAAPIGWLLCNGQEVLISSYTQLYNVIQNIYKPNPAVGYFGIPDLRGRFPLGKDNMGDVNAGVVTDPAADILGAKNGVEDVTLFDFNLPDHVHDLRGQSGEQFYTIRDIAGTPADDAAIVYDAPTGSGAGQALSNSGSVDSDADINQPFSVLNPFMTLNYIIYAGQG